MRNLLALAAVAALAVGAACQYPAPGPTSIEITNTNTNTQGGGPQASPSPSPEAGGTVARVEIGKVAETPASAPQACSNAGDSVKVGCVAFLTCSPFDARGTELFDPASIGTAPESFRVISGETLVTAGPHGSNPFNMDVTGKAAGEAVLECRVRGVTGTMRLRVVS